MTAKEYLEQVKIIDMGIALRKEKYEKLYSYLNCGLADFVPSDEAVAKVVDCQNKLNDEILLLLKFHNIIEKSINMVISEPYVREIFERKYILFQTWDEISDKMNYSVVHLHRLHKEYLPKFDTTAMAFEVLNSYLSVREVGL